AGFECDLATGTCRKGATVATFQQGVGGYDGTLDTYVHAGAPDADNSLATTLLVDGVPPDGEERQILLRFDRVFGTDPGQVPAGSPIASATLTVFVTNPSADGADLSRMVRTWAGTDTWNSLAGGVATDGVEAMAEADASGATNANRVAYDIDVTKSVVAWSGGQANLGWVFVMPAGGTDSWQLSSSEELDESERPKLTIRYLPCEPGWTGDGVTCNDFNECGQAEPPCDEHAKCTNFVGGYSCECDSGWEGDGATCADVDECSADTYPCDKNATCTNEPGAYICACKPGFEGNGKTCADRDECSWIPFPCDPNAECANKPGSFACTCKDGFVGNGATCGECPGGAADPCGGRGECAGTAASPACKCDEGFGGDACEDCVAGLWGPACDQPCAGGAENPCNDHGNCSGGMAGTGACTCYDGFAGDACDACAAGFFAYPDCTNCPQCGDGNVCTDDSCDIVTGCVNAFNTAACDDDNACTLEDTCSGGECLGQVVDCIDDGDPCTEESCDPATGLCSSAPIPGCGTPDTGPDAVAEVSEGTGEDAGGEDAGGEDAGGDGAGSEGATPDDGAELGTEPGTEPVPDSGPGDDTKPGEDGQPVGDEGQGDGVVPPDAWDGDVDLDALNLPDGGKVKVGGGGGCSSAAGAGAGALHAVLLPGLLVLGGLLLRRRRG
ncbi:MAG: DNRLRE domain-containing protein, partial [Deltaproteobacteria bacterium]|nr:DNRLRE domain-containing protein [Deltaproteobacteria bacterium]